MSDIWTQYDGTAHIVPAAFDAWRVVEGQHIVATRKLVDTLAEQEILESLLETAKPQMPADPALAGLHYLLSTPFRYPPLRNGSRFGTRQERGLWYGSLTREVALAERAYYRLLFLAGTTAALEPILTEDTVFRAAVVAQRCIDLTAPPFVAHTKRISDPDRYADAQALGRVLREAGVQALVFESARDRQGGRNCGLFEPVFASPEPFGLETWVCCAARSGVEFRNRFLGLAMVFERGGFEVNGVLPQPGV